jgi:nitrite reductase (NADH) large subunit
METDVIHNAPYLMNRQLDRMSAELLRTELEQQGMRFWLNKETESIIGLNRAKGVRFTGGSTLEADLIVVSVGIRPNMQLAKTCGIETDRAIIVDDFMRTNIPHVYAVGECAEHRGTAYGLVAPLYEQGRVLARVLCGQDTEPYTGSVPYAQLKVSGVEVFSVGDIREGEADTALQMYDGVRGTYKKVTMKGGTVRGAILFGDTAEGSSLLSLVKRKAPVSVLAAPAGNGGGGALDDAAADMPDRETVCACNAVSKAAIMRAVIEDGLQTPEQVRDCTKASSSCGGCRPMMEAVVRYALRNGKEGLSSAAPPVCSCTELNHEMLKASIAQRKFSDISETMLSLGWKKPLGCEICQSSIRYYIELFHPELSIQEASSSKVVKYNSISVGIKTSEDAAKGDVYNSRYLGETLRKVWEPLSLPYPVKASITSGINNPAGVLVHEIGITGAPAGWEIYAGGHAEHPVKQGQLVGIAETDTQAVELAVSCIQLYRERACYGEAMWKWIDREGIVELREMLFDLDFRQELVDRAVGADMPNKIEERLGEGICGNC